jgi:uncharacterized protein (TIRG00374 family)
MKKYIGWSVTIFFLIFTLTKINYSIFISELNNIKIFWVTVSIFLIGIGYIFRAVRWWLLLSFVSEKPPFILTLKYFFIGNSLNNMLPLRGGDIYRIVKYNNLTGIKIEKVLATMAIERIFDVLSLLLLLWIGLSSFEESNLINSYSPQIKSAIINLNILCIIAVITIIIVPKYMQQLISYLFNKKIIPKKIYLFIFETFESLKSILYKKNVLTIFIISTIAWAIESCAYGAVQNAMSLNLPINAMFISNVFSALSTLLPSSPGYIGTYHYFASLSLTPFQVDIQQAITFSIIMHLILWTSITSFGLLAYFLKNNSGNIKE